MPVVERDAGSSQQAADVDLDAGAPRFPGDTTAGSVDRERIAERAYQKYMERGGSDGRDLDDWLEAEEELARRGNSRTSTTGSGT